VDRQASPGSCPNCARRATIGCDATGGHGVIKASGVISACRAIIAHDAVGGQMVVHAKDTTTLTESTEDMTPHIHPSAIV
jgi:hypothetical protein